MTSDQKNHLLVACLCADWCGACREYQPLFEALAAKFPQAHFKWVDVEDESELIDPIEVENFPTILIAKGKNPLFFGTVLPHIETLERLIQVNVTGDSSAVTDPEVVKLAAKLQSWQAN